ncbi:hypothetical protein K2W90_05325 [Candidatus Babeliales bacterium]|nr:hypothetical protein [Candidatus Babeliales bacterium]
MNMRNILVMSAVLFMGTLSAYDIEALMAGRTLSEESRKQFQTLDQQFCFFKTCAEDPYMIVFHPGKNEITTIACGTLDKQQGPRRAKSAADFENLTVIRNTIIFADPGLKLDQKLRGYRKTIIGKFLDNLLKDISFLPDRKYDGTVLVDQYKVGMPMKWVLRDTKDFQAIKKYLEKHFGSMLIPAKKPLLVLEITNSKDPLAIERSLGGLSQEDVDFLETYFELADPQDPEVVAYFKACQEIFMDTQHKFDSPKVVGRSFGEIVFDAIEKRSDDFKLVDYAGAIIATLATMVLFDSCKEALKSNIYDPVRNNVSKKVSECKAKIEGHEAVIAGTLAVGLGAWITYKLVQAQNQKEADAGLDAEMSINADIEEEVQA